jgi:hypothetical protein
MCRAAFTALLRSGSFRVTRHPAAGAAGERRFLNRNRAKRSELRAIGDGGSYTGTIG